MQWEQVLDQITTTAPLFPSSFELRVTIEPLKLRSEKSLRRSPKFCCSFPFCKQLPLLDLLGQATTDDPRHYRIFKIRISSATRTVHNVFPLLEPGPDRIGAPSWSGPPAGHAASR